MYEDCLPTLPYPMTPSRRSLMLFTASAAGILLGGRIAGAMEATAPPKPDNLLTPDASLKRLMESMRATCRAYHDSTISGRSAKL